MCHKLLARGERINGIAALSSTGMVALELTNGTVNGEKFFDFLRYTTNSQHVTIQWDQL